MAAFTEVLVFADKFKNFKTVSVYVYLERDRIKTCKSAIGSNIHETL